MAAASTPVMDSQAMCQEMKKGMDTTKMPPKDHGKANQGQMVYEMKQKGGM